MNILILGGSGILSTDFTKKVIDEGNNVWILNRGRWTAFIDKRANLLIADLRNESVENIIKKLPENQFDVVVDYLSYDVKQLKKTLRILSNRFQQYILISSATAYIKKDGDIIREETHRVGNMNWSYSYNKSLCEDFIRRQGIKYTIIRPYVTYGKSRLPFQLIPDGYQYTLIERIKNDKPVVLLDNGKAICTLTNTVDFANILYSLLLNEKAYGEAFHITSNYTQTWKHVYESYCRILNKAPKLISVDLKDIKKYMPEYYQILKGDKGTSWKFDNTKVLNAIGGYDFKITLEDGLKQSIEYFENNISMQGVDYKWDAKIDYMIKKTSGTKGLKIIESTNPNSNSKANYYIIKTPILHDIYMFIWRMKHRNG